MKRYCNISCHALVATAFFALAMTGRLDLPSIVVFMPVFGLSFYRTLKKRPYLLKSGGAFHLSWIFLAFSVLDFTVFSRTLIGTAIHMVLFLELVKLHQDKTDRDYVYIIVLAFLKILAASSLTVDISFAGTLLAFIAALVSTLTSFEIYRTGRKSRMTTREAVAALSSVNIWATLCIVVIASGLFFVIPRVGTGFFTQASVPPLLLSGFSDSVELGQIGRLKQSSAIVMHAQRVAGTPFSVLKWRGGALDTFDGARWFRQDRTRKNVRPENSTYIFRREPARGELVTYDILLEPLATTTLFGPRQVRQIYGRRIPGVEVDRDGAIYARFQRSERLQYQVQSEIVKPVTADLKQEAESLILPADQLDPYLQLPGNLDTRIRILANEITRGAQSPLERALRVETYLRRNYEYTLELTWNPGADPLGTFLFQAKSGHCEYFASSMAILLRAVGVPTRMVNGFLMGEYNPVGDAYIIRQSDAHAWVEAYLPGAGWTEFDPTPGGANQQDTGLTAQFLNYVDALGLFWNTYVLTYDTDSQGQLVHSAHESVESFRKRLEIRRDEFVLAAKRAAGQFLLGIQRTLEGPAAWICLAAALAAYLVYGSRHEIRNRWWLFLLRRTGRVDNRIVGSLFYSAIRLAERKETQRRSSQTWREWIGTVSHDQRRSVLQRALDVFEKSKYGPGPSSAGDVAILQEALRDLRSLIQ